MFIAYYPKHSRHLKTPRGIPQFCFCIGNVPLPTLLPTEWSGRIEAHGGIDYTAVARTCYPFKASAMAYLYLSQGQEITSNCRLRSAGTHWM